jgi:hypothetical protein
MYLSNTQERDEFENALLRYAVVAQGGLRPLAGKRVRLSTQDIDAGFSFLARKDARQLACILETLSPVFDAYGTSQAQKERVRRSLRGLIDWARELRYLPYPENPIPSDLCSDIPVGLLSSQNWKYSTRQIVENYLQPLDERTRKSTLDAIVRYFGPACGGPVPLHHPLRADELEAGLVYLDQVPLEYLQEALTVTTRVMRIYNLCEAQETRIRRKLRALLEWAREQGYLPFPEPKVKPEYPTAAEPPVPTGELFYPKHAATALECFAEYTLNLNAKEMPSFKSLAIKHVVPVLGGPQIAGHLATPEETQAALAFLDTVALDEIQQLLITATNYFSTSLINKSSQRVYLSQIKRWLVWAQEDGYFGSIAEPEIAFRTFHNRPVELRTSPSGLKMNRDQAPVHQLGAKAFPNDYINDALAQQIQDYCDYRANKPGRKATPGSLKGEVEKIRQFMGWLHRHEGVALADLRFEKLISVCQLKFRIKDGEDFEAFWLAKQSGEHHACDTADEDLKRIQRYIAFTGGKASSQQKRVSVVIAMAKFLYRDLLGTNEFLREHNIPMLLRLLDLQSLLKYEAQRQPATIKYHEKSVAWADIIYAMEMQRRRAEQTTIYSESRVASLGYTETQRPDTAIAKELQRFLSLALHVAFPSRPRTFYDLKIGKTFKEGLLTSTGFISAGELSANGRADEIKFYVHHGVEDYKTGSSMSTVLLNNDGFWMELPNIPFNDKNLYGYVRRWLDWGRLVIGPVEHDYFFRMAFSTRPVPDRGDWSQRIKAILGWWTGVTVPPGNIRKIFTGQFPEYREAGALLLQHSEDRHKHEYDMRVSIEKMAPVVQANVDFIDQILKQIPQDKD